MKSITFKYLLDGKEIQKINSMFDNQNFSMKIDDDKVFFTTVSSPASKFSSEESERMQDIDTALGNQRRYREDLIKYLKNSNGKEPYKTQLINSLQVQVDELPPHTEADLVESLKAWGDRLTGNRNSTRHKYNPNADAPKFSRNVQDALQRTEEHQAKNGREENKEAERFGGDGIYWMLRPTTKEEKKVISDLEVKQRDLGKGLSQYDTTSSIKERTGIKHSKGKLFYELDFGFIKQLAERMQQNKENSKYALFNWKKPMIDEDIENLKQALLRHVLAVMEGEYEDDGRPFGHLESISNNAMMINYQLKQK